MLKKPPFLENIKQVHLVGIKGVGMTSLACCLQDLRIKVSGSDVSESFVTDPVLERRKINWHEGFADKNLLPKPDLVITTGAHGGLDNPEVKSARQIGIPILTHAQALGKLMEGKDGISVCGVGGKTTAASMIATILAKNKRLPSYAIGVAEIFPLGDPGKYDQGHEFIAEADEYANTVGVDNRPRFSFQNPKLIVATNIEYDHPDVYRDLNQTKSTFRQFFTKVPADGLLVANVDNHNLATTISGINRPLQSYGFSPLADWQIQKVRQLNGKSYFNLVHQRIVYEDISLSVPGRFNILNATASVVVSNYLGLTDKEIKSGLIDFKGSKRRFEFVGESKGVKVYDDYAHDPHEIKAALEAVKDWFPKSRIVVIFQPHSFSRTKALLPGFAQSFGSANLVVITEIYRTKREEEDRSVSGQTLVEQISRNQEAVYFKPGEKEVLEFIVKNARNGDVIITMGAGDIYKWGRSILKSLK